MGSSICRSRCIRVLDEVAQMAVLLFADWCFQRNWFLCNAHDLSDLVDWHIQFFCDFLCCRIVSVFMQQLAGNLFDLVDGFHHVYRDADGPCLIGNRTGDGLTNPPGRIGGEFKTLGVVKFLHRFDQTQVAFLNQIQKLHPASNISFCNADNQSKVRFRKTLSGIRVPLCHPLCQLDLLLGSQQRHATDFLQIHLDRVVDTDALNRQQCIVILVVFAIKILAVQIGQVDVVHDVDVQRFQCVIQLVHLFHIEIQLLQRIVDLSCCQLAIGFSAFDQAADHCLFVLYCQTNSSCFSLPPAV